MLDINRMNVPEQMLVAPDGHYTPPLQGGNGMSGLRTEKFACCPICGTSFRKRSHSHRICSDECRDKVYSHRCKKPGAGISSWTTGAAIELIVSVDLLLSGWAVFRALSPHCFCDLIAVKEEQTRYLEVRSGQTTLAGICFKKNHRAGATEFAVVVLPDQKVHYYPIG